MSQSNTERDTGSVPQKVTHTMILIHGIAREMLVQKLTKVRSFEPYPNCHALARSYAAVFPHLAVHDGGVITIDSTGRPLPRYHSWLAFAEFPAWGIDVAPLGAVPILTFPNLIYLADEHALWLDGTLSAEKVEDAAKTSMPFASVLTELRNKLWLDHELCIQPPARQTPRLYERLSFLYASSNILPYSASTLCRTQHPAEP